MNIAQIIFVAAAVIAYLGLLALLRRIENWTTKKAFDRWVREEIHAEEKALDLERPQATQSATVGQRDQDRAA